MLESHKKVGESLVVLPHAYNDIRYSLCPFPGAIAVAVANDTEWDMCTTALNDVTAWPLLSDKDGKVICPKELVGSNCFKHFGMLDEVLWQVKPNGQAPPLTEDVQLSLASKASAEEGVNIANVPVIRGQSQEQKKEQVEELADNCSKAGHNTLTPSTLLYTWPQVLHLKMSHRTL